MRRSTLVGWLALLGLIGCGDPAAPGTARARVSLDFRALAPSFVSVLGSARLTIESNGKTTTRTLTIGDSDASIQFEVDVEQGSARFLLDVLSNNGSTLYHAERTETIDRDGFAVALDPVAVGPVLVVSPREPTFFFFDTGSERFAAAAFEVRNAGIGQLRWRLEQAAAPDTVRVCSVGPRGANCLLEQTWDPPLLKDSVAVLFDAPTGSASRTRTLSFQSNVGTAAFTVTIP